MCSECNDIGHLGFINPHGWLAGEIGDNWPFRLMIKRECPKCHGDPASQLPPRPNYPIGSQQPPPRSVLELCAEQMPPGAGMGWHLAHGMNLLAAIEREKRERQSA